MKRKHLYEEFELMKLDGSHINSKRHELTTPIQTGNAITTSTTGNSITTSSTTGNAITISTTGNAITTSSATGSSVDLIGRALLNKRSRIFDHMFTTMNPEHSQMVLYKPVKSNEDMEIDNRI
jgi:hypothetical protein